MGDTQDIPAEMSEYSCTSWLEPSIDHTSTCMYEKTNDCRLKSLGANGERKVIFMETLPSTSMVNMLFVEVYW